LTLIKEKLIATNLKSDFRLDVGCTTNMTIIES